MDNGRENYKRFLYGDEDGLVEIIREYKDGLILYLNGFVQNIHLAEELAEDTFVKLGVKKPRDKCVSSFKTWLYTIARNGAIDHLRKNARTRTVALDACASIPAEQEDLEMLYIRKERRRMMYRAMNRLKPEYHQVLWLVYFEEFSYQQIAKIMKKSVHNIETLVYRARRSLKTELEKEGYVYENL